MKNLILLVLILSPWAVSLGQVSGFEFSPQELKGLQLITSNHTNYSSPSDSTNSRTVYEITPSGKVTRSDTYENGVKVHWEKNRYGKEGRLESTESHGRIYSYDEKVQDHVPALLDDFYHLTTYEYKQDRLYRVRSSNFAWGSGTLDTEKTYEYDKIGRKIKETITYLHVGLEASFARNTATLDSIYYKGAADRIVTKFRHSRDSIIETRFDKEGNVEGYTHSKINSRGQVEEWEMTDKNGSKVMRGVNFYNKAGKIIRSKSTTIDISKSKGDTMAGDEFVYKYNSAGKLTSKTVFSENRRISIETITYK
ncbi:hypothetical protein [Rufibacter hautae]|uniref:RHS repeat protein n=1 Tax=Rufibacter hautae TaxID=2595005 RepID=A0A5B6TJ22_9BACT|nr:hypothetical protein [Rufibacter hautae]KAA3440026.1 hypothetical protein FOA19_04985 [Rufibacter hautae]